MEVRFEDHYFSDGMRWTVLIILGALDIYLLFWFQAFIFVGIIALVILYFFTTKYVTIIDTQNKIIKDLFFVFLIKSGKYLRFRTLHSIRIDKQRYTYNANQRARDRTADYFIYTGTLLYDNNKKLELSTKTDYSWFSSEMKRLAEELQIPLERSY
ncbi:hypothetical protein [Ekhidna sp.]